MASASMAAALLAAAAIPVEVVGFSPDDRYVAFIEHGIREGSGHPWARFHALDVARSAEAAAPIEVVLDSGTEEEAVRKARAAATAALGKLRIASWVAPRAIQHEANGELSDREGAPVGTLQIQARAASGKEKASCDEPFRPLLLRLVMFFLDDDRPARLAQDAQLPKVRPCASACELAGMFAHGKAALAVVKCTVPGFEGPAARYDGYAGVFPYALGE